MYRSVCWLSLDLGRRDVQGVVSLTQGETGRTLKFRLFENGAPYVPPEGCYVVLSGVMDNRLVIYNDCYVNDGIVIYDITDATALHLVGVMNCQLEIHSLEGGVVCSPKFQIVVHSAIYAKKEVESSEQFFALQKLIEDIGSGLGNGQGGGTSSSGGCKIEFVTLHSDDMGFLRPSLSSSKIYEKYKTQGIVFMLSHEGKLYRMCEPLADTVTFEYTTVEYSEGEGGTVSIKYSYVIYGEYAYSMSQVASGGSSGSSSGGLWLTGKNIYIFGDDYQYATTLVDELERLTGATVYNCTIEGTSPCLCNSATDLQNAFSLTRMMTTNFLSYGVFSELENAIETAQDAGEDTTRYEEVLELLYEEAPMDFVIFAYGISAYANNATLKNPTSSYDTSTFVGALRSSASMLSLYRYKLPTIASVHDRMRNGGMWSADWGANEAGHTFKDYLEGARQMTIDCNLKFMDLFNCNGISGLVGPYAYISTPISMDGSTKYGYLTDSGQLLIAGRIAAQIL